MRYANEATTCAIGEQIADGVPAIIDRRAIVVPANIASYSARSAGGIRAVIIFWRHLRWLRRLSAIGLD